MYNPSNDFYKTLQVDPAAEPEVIKAAYRRLADKYHPDKNKSPDALDRMQRINEAYSVLGDNAKRAQYDSERQQAHYSQSTYTKKESKMNERQEGAGISLYHAFVLLDGSGSMTEAERNSGKPKHKAVAEMVQNLINEMYDNPSISNTQLTIVCYDSNSTDDIRLSDYDVKSNMHYNQNNLDLWDPTRGHGGATPIGRALASGRNLAEQWVNAAQGMEVRRAVIYLLTDGMNYPDTEPNGLSERQKIKDFNAQQETLREQGGFKGRIRTAALGYYQFPQGTNSEEDKGRDLLKNLPDNPNAYFETASAPELVDYIVRTITR